MSSKPACYDERISPLVRLFVERSGLGLSTKPEDVMMNLIERVRRVGHSKKHIDPIQLFLDERNIKRVQLLPELKCDGFIEPAGSTFADGFTMVLKKGATEPRMRFTMAHEICHTFFYELVPALKFVPHSPDQYEERLCNIGAAALLMPAAALKRRAKNLPVCLESLHSLSEDFSVSLPTMAIRLKALGIWRCEFSRWRRMLNGTFVLDQFYGGRRAEWSWDDNSILTLAWDSNKPLIGRTFVSYEDRLGTRRYKPIAYQVRRSMDGITALWANSISSKPLSAALPLFIKKK